MDMLKDLGLAGILGMIGVIGWFLRQKDEAQAKQITMLWSKHDEDAKALADLKLEIAKEHYIKSELDARFTHLEVAFKAGFDHLGAKFDRLTDILVAHVSKEDGK
jgi:hypothetical protein